MNEATGQAITLGLQLLACLAILSELIPRLLTLWRLRGVHNGLLSFRVVTAIKSLGILLVTLWSGLVRVDVVYLDRGLLGPFLDRWRVDGVVWTVLAAGAVLVSWLYWRTIHRQEWRQRK